MGGGFSARKAALPAEMPYQRTPLAIVGSGGHAKCVVECVEQQGRYAIVAFIDDFKVPGSRVFGHPVLGPCNAEIVRQLRELGVETAVVAIGDNATRARVVEKLRTLWPTLVAATIVHPSAIVSRSASIGNGTVVLPGAIIHVDCRVGIHCIINTKASLDHDCVMGDFSALAPGATISGYVQLGNYSWIAAGAVVVHGRKIGEHTVIGAGAVVVRDMPAFVVAFGNPARPVRTREATDKYL
jgi:sugar O-acyltransferase (sialic acid O-acetyltransferase NeuD family)